MSRIGITYNDVASVAQLLTAEGKNPTIENIRVITGTGSSTTIAHHLKSWKENRERERATDKEEIPSEMTATVKGLWERMVNMASDKVTEVKQNLEQTIIELQDETNRLKEENEQWQNKYIQIENEKTEIIANYTALSKTMRQLEDEKVAWIAAEDGLNQLLQEKQNRIDELGRLYKQVQTNLEHFWEATREQRIIEEQRHMQIQTQLEQNIHQLKQDLNNLGQEKSSLQNEHQQLRYSHENLEKQFTEQNRLYESIKIEFTNTEKAMIKFEESKNHWQSQYAEANKKLEERNVLCSDLQTKLAVLKQEKIVCEKELKEITDENKLLSHDKWILEEEKIQLLDHLKQFEKLT